MCSISKNGYFVRIISVATKPVVNGAAFECKLHQIPIELLCRKVMKFCKRHSHVK